MKPRSFVLACMWRFVIGQLIQYYLASLLVSLFAAWQGFHPQAVSARTSLLVSAGIYLSIELAAAFFFAMSLYGWRISRDGKTLSELLVDAQSKLDRREVHPPRSGTSD